MTRMPVFSDRSESPTIIKMIQAQEMLLMEIRRDDHWDVEYRRFNSRKKHLGTYLLAQATDDDLKRYYLHLVEKQLEVLK